MEKGWRLNIPYVERRERIKNERLTRRLHLMKCEMELRELQRIAERMTAESETRK